MMYDSVEQLQMLIDNQIEESTTLEYKSSFAIQKPKWKEELAKDVSAMANSNGGTIIYGLREKDGGNGRAIPEKLLPVPNSEMSKDQLTQLLSSNIQPIIEGIEISYIPNDDRSGFFVLNIPKSFTAHQNRLTHVYYMRRNATVEAMEDYAVRDVMNRSKNPIIDIEFTLHRITKNVTEKKMPIVFSQGIQEKTYQEVKHRLIFSPVNNGEVYAKYVNYYVYVPKDLVDNDNNNYEEEGDYVIVYGENTTRDLTAINGMHKEYGPLRYDPILPGMRSYRKVVDISFEEIESIEDLPPLKYEVHADNAPTRTISVEWNTIKVTKEEKYEVIDPFTMPRIPIL